MLAFSTTVLGGLVPSGMARAMDLPHGGEVVAGEAQIHAVSPTHLKVQQGSDKAAINWQGFSIAADAHVEFEQPNVRSTTLNRVTGNQISDIRGRITATGQVVLINPAGMIFTETAQVHVGSLIASTLEIAPQDFMSGNYVFAGSSDKTIENHGVIETHSGGMVALIAAQIVNSGSISTPQGATILAAAGRVRLDLGGPLQIEIEEGALEAAIDNGGAIRAPDGFVYLTAAAANELRASAINHAGLIQATSIKNIGGRVVLEGDDITLASGSEIDSSGALGGGQVLVGGDWQGGQSAERRVFAAADTLREALTVTMEADAVIQADATEKGDGGTVVLWTDVTNPNSVTAVAGRISAEAGISGGNGGQIETSGARLVTTGVQVSTKAPLGETGEWLLDPDTDLHLSQVGDTDGDIENVAEVNTILDALANSNVRIFTWSADVYVNSAINYTGANTLTIDAGGHLLINKNITSGGLKLLSKDSIRFEGGAVTLTTTNADRSAGQLILSSGYDGSNGTFRALHALTIRTAGGDVVFGGSNTDGTGFTIANDWRGLEFTGLDIQTNGGHVTMRGQSVNGEGVLFQGTTTISTGGGNIYVDARTNHDRGLEFLGSSSFDSGTGTIYLKGHAGVTATSNNNAHHGIYFAGSSASFTSSNPTSNAIKLVGIGTRGRGIDVYSGAFSLQSLSPTGGIVLDGTRGTALNWSISLAGSSNRVLAAGGLIDIIARDVGGVTSGTDGYLNLNGAIIGRLAGSAVPTSSADLQITANKVQPNPFYANTTGTIDILPFSDSFGETFSTANSLRVNSDAGGAPSALTIGTTNNTANVTLANPISINGPIEVYGGVLTTSSPVTSAGAITLMGSRVLINSSLTSTGTGDILLQANTDFNSSVELASTSSVLKTGGAASTLTIKGVSRISAWTGSTISGSVGSPLNVIFWSDYDGDGGDGGVSAQATIATYGGHVWMGGSDTAYGAQQWNGLTVGDGASEAGNGYNWNAIDLRTPSITTSGGDIWIRAGSGYSNGYNGISIYTDVYLDTGSGDITLEGDRFEQIEPAYNIIIAENTTGVLTIKPYTNDWTSFGTVFDITGNFTGTRYQGTLEFVEFQINDVPDLGGLIIGKPGTNVGVKFHNALQVNGPIEAYGKFIEVSSGLTSTNGGITLSVENQIWLYGNISATGDILMKTVGVKGTGTSDGYIYLAPNQSITTSGAQSDIIFWTNSGFYG